MKRALRQLTQVEQINFLLTNRVPRMALTHFMGWFSQLRHPWLARVSIAVWRLFTDLDLSDARQQRFDSLHDCFTRELVEGARAANTDPEILVSPSDGIVGACGHVRDGQLFQCKGSPYQIDELFGAGRDVSAWRDGCYVTLRLTSAMYHRFHAPHDGEVLHVSYHSGDTWNVNPIALARVERLFCRNERAVLYCQVGEQRWPVALVPVAAILVASIRLHFLDVLLHLRYRGAHELPCRAAFHKGQELGWFQHGSTILVFTPPGFKLAADITPGHRIRAGEALMHLPTRTAAEA